MLWRPARVASFAYDVGLRGDDLATATALALGISGGDDAYVWRVDPGPMVDQRGLWGIDVVRFPQYAADDLTRPTVNARAMAGLYASSDPRWSWAAIDWRTLPTSALDAAAVAASRPSRTQPPASSVAERALAGPYGDALRSSVGLRESVTNLTIGRLAR